MRLIAPATTSLDGAVEALLDHIKYKRAEEDRDEVGYCGSDPSIQVVFHSSVQQVFFFLTHLQHDSRS
jgi:hypothetical protein